jgi:hypothetical protein
MKKYLTLFAIPAMVFFSSCGNEQPETSEVSIPDGWVQFDLGEESSHYSLNMYLNVPGEAHASGTPEILEGPYGGTQIRVGTIYNIEITPGGQTLEEKKDEIQANPIFKITYLVNDPEGFIYKSEIGDGEIVQYHFFVSRKVGNINYSIENIKDDIFSEESINQMYESIKSLRLK